MQMKTILLATAAAVAMAPAHAETTDEAASNAFSLGQIIVTGARPKGIEIGDTTLSSEAIYVFNRNSLDEAANLIPGVSSGNSGGSRNERLVFVRGFDRFQVPISIDGIRVYLPADNRLDYGRFLTPDIAEIQVAKGYASVLDGPGAMGGAINLVTRKPTKELEAEVRGTLNLDRGADYAGYNTFASLGTKRDRWYAQASYTRSFNDHWDLPSDYSPTVGSVENGGARNNSRTRDWRVNAKAGFTPNDTDEYSISYTRQEGQKNAPLHVTDPGVTAPPAPNPRYWTWPYWNIESIYFLSTTQLGDRATFKTRAYRNKFNNLLSSFDNATQTTQTLGRSFNSYYKDKAYGGSAQLDVDFDALGALSLAFHYRRDEHVEFQQSFPAGTTEPPQTNKEDTYSAAAEYRAFITPTLSMTLGVSYDWRELRKAEEFGTPPTGGAARIFEYPRADASAFNFQERIDWRPDDATEVHASLSRRARFPTIFERFSTQFGTAASNPGLKPERSMNYEIGGSRRMGDVRVEGAVFYSDVQNAIVAVRPAGFPAGSTQRRNLGDGKYYGGEIAVSWQPLTTLELGANYTYIRRDFDIFPQAGVTVPVFALTDVPTHKGFAYARWTPIERLSIYPNIDFASKRTTLDTFVPTAPTAVRYYRTGAYVQANLRIDYQIIDNVDIGVGARNIFDKYYVLTDGFPEQGRSFFASIRARY
jgi:iron complex outermembrane receptor protein